jgi:hypothetical protein
MFDERQRDIGDGRNPVSADVEALPADVRALPEKGCVDAPCDQANDQEEVAGVEPEGRERGEVALRDDDKDTKKSCAKPHGLHRLQPVAEQAPSRERNEHRTGGAQHEPVQSLRPDKSEIGKRIVAARPDHPQKYEHQPVLSDGCGVSLQVLPCEGKEDQRGEHPAQAGKRHGRDFAHNASAEHEISGPEYRDQSKK